MTTFAFGASDIKDSIFELQEQGVSDKTLARHEKLMREALESTREYRRLLVAAVERSGERD